MRAQEGFIPWSELESTLTMLDVALNANDVSVIRQSIKELVVEYRPNNDIVDWVYLKQRADTNMLKS